MSVTVARRVRCPHCDETFAADLYWSLHATRSPHVREAVLARRFQRFACPACGGIVVAEPTMLYTDFQRHQWFATFPAGALAHRDDLAKLVTDGFDFNMRVNAPPLVQGWADHMSVRVVFGLAWLREKLMLHDAGYDDRLVEILKLQLVRRTSVRLFSPQLPVVVDEVDDEGLTVAIHDPGTGDRTQVVRTHRVPRAAYGALEHRRDALAQAMPELFDGVVVDWRAPLAARAPLPRGPGDAEQTLIDRLYTGAP